MSNIRTRVFTIIIAGFLISVTALAIMSLPHIKNIIDDFRGYDYQPKMTAGYDWVGPKSGEFINPNYLADSKGNTFATLSKNELALLTIIDPACEACQQASDQIRTLDETLPEKGVDRFVVSFVPAVTPSKLDEYVNSVNLNTTSLTWSNGFESVLPAIKAIAYPTHILIDKKGTVIKCFPGTSQEKNVRDRMVKEILRQVDEEKNQRSNQVAK